MLSAGTCMIKSFLALVGVQQGIQKAGPPYWAHVDAL